MKLILKKPHTTEKTSLGESQNRFVFKVSSKANKNQIKVAVQDAFKVTVTKINTITVPGKTKRIGKSRRTVKAPSFKKAIVQLKDGDKIKLFSSKEKAIKTTK